MEKERLDSGGRPSKGHRGLYGGPASSDGWPDGRGHHTQEGSRSWTSRDAKDQSARTKAFTGTRDAKALENNCWDIPQYFGTLGNLTSNVVSPPLILPKANQIKSPLSSQTKEYMSRKDRKEIHSVGEDRTFFSSNNIDLFSTDQSLFINWDMDAI